MRRGTFRSREKAERISTVSEIHLVFVRPMSPEPSRSQMLFVRSKKKKQNRRKERRKKKEGHPVDTDQLLLSPV